MVRSWMYLSAFLFPCLWGLGLYFKGLWIWSVPVVAFVCLPVLEQWLPLAKENLSDQEEEKKSKHPFYDLLLLANVPVLFFLLFQTVIALDSTTDLVVRAGIVMMAGMTLGINGINIAHELGHRPDKLSQWMAQLLLWPSAYMHFYIEHNLGHHRYVSTDKDPASARRNETVYAFWFRSLWGSWRSAWRLERERLSRESLPFWHVKNRMLWYSSLQAAWFITMGWVFSLEVAGLMMLVSLVSILMLETVNYIEHYGLRRREIRPGHYESVKPWHSWNSDFIIGRIVLFDLTRHSDHHYKSTRPYQILRHLPESPQLPAGYPACMVLSLIPPLWFRIIHPRIPTSSGEAITK
jgi:alkane 1-monooxygenase